VNTDEGDDDVDDEDEDDENIAPGPQQASSNEVESEDFLAR